MKKRLLLLVATVATIFSGNAQAVRPNVIVMIADDLGYGDVSCLSHGSVQTPQIDRLAKMGVTFSSGYVTAPLCVSPVTSKCTTRGRIKVYHPGALVF